MVAVPGLRTRPAEQFDALRRFNPVTRAIVVGSDAKEFHNGGLGGLIVLGLDLWAIISVIGSNRDTGAKVLWTLLILVLPIIGFIIWLLAGPRSARAV